MYVISCLDNVWSVSVSVFLIMDSKWLRLLFWKGTNRWSCCLKFQFVLLPYFTINLESFMIWIVLFGLEDWPLISNLLVAALKCEWVYVLMKSEGVWDILMEIHISIMFKIWLFLFYSWFWVENVESSAKIWGLVIWLGLDCLNWCLYA